MPAPYGVTPTGLSRPSVQEELAIVEAAQRANISPTLDVSTDSVLGQFNGILAQRTGIVWEALEAIHAGNDPDRAEDDQLISLSKITGTDQRGASKSQVPTNVTLEVGTVLQAGVHFAHVIGKPDVRFTPTVDFTAPSTGTFLRTFEAETTGPILVSEGTLAVIATPVVGWGFVENTADATPGRDIDDNEDLRLRREQGLALSGSSGVDQIRADVLAVKDVTSCQVFENYTDVTSDQALPPKSFQVVLWDDAGADNDAVAQAIWVSKPGGIQPIGTETGTAIDKKGKPQAMRFSRAAAVLMWLEFDLTPQAGYVGAAAFKLAIATALDAAKGTGSAVAKWDLQDAAHGRGAKILNVRFGISPAPTADDEVPISQLSIARFDTSRILVNGA